MNLLIIGGLFVLAVLAIVGAIFAARGESRTISTANARIQIPAPIESTVTPTRKLPEESMRTAPLPPITTTLRERSMPLHIEDQASSISNGQFYELAAELRTLHLKAQDVEQRLGALVETVNHLQRPQKELVDNDVTHIPGTPSSAR